MIESLRALPPLGIMLVGAVLMGAGQVSLAAMTFGRQRRWLEAMSLRTQVALAIGLATTQTVGLVLLNLGIAFWLRAGA